MKFLLARKARPAVLGWVGLALALGFVLLKVFPVLLSRVGFPLGIDHQEEIHLALLAQWLRGDYPLYAPPSLHHSSWVYTPGYYFAAAAWTYLTNLSLPALRVFSWLCIVLTTLPVVVMADVFYKQRWWGLLWLPLYLLFFGLYGWIDLAMKDSFHTLLCFWAWCLMAQALFIPQSEARQKKYLIGSAFIWALALLTKQTTLIQLVPVGLALLFYSRRLGQIFCTAHLLFAVAMLGLCTLAWGKIFWIWTWLVPQAHPYSSPIGFGVARQVLDHSYALFIIVAVGLGLALSEKAGRGDKFKPYLLISFWVGALLSAIISASKIGGGIFNFALLMASSTAIIAIALPLIFRGRWAAILILLPLLFRTADKRAMSDLDYVNARNLIGRIRALPGKVWVPYHPWLAHLAGHPAYAPADSIYSQWRAGQQSIPAELLQAFARQEFDWIVFDARNDPHLFGEMPSEVILGNYKVYDELPIADRIIPRDGWPTRHPSVFYKKIDL